MGETFVDGSLVNWKLEKAGRRLGRGEMEGGKKEERERGKERKEKVYWGRDLKVKVWEYSSIPIHQTQPQARKGNIMFPEPSQTGW